MQTVLVRRFSQRGRRWDTNQAKEPKDCRRAMGPRTLPEDRARDSGSDKKSEKRFSASDKYRHEWQSAFDQLLAVCCGYFLLPLREVLGLGNCAAGCGTIAPPAAASARDSANP
jgi:hypothetical protein